MPKDRLKPGFDPIWQSDYLDIRLKKLSRTAYIMRQMYRSYRNPGTNICNLSDYQIRSITGWHLESIKKAREQLIKLEEITPQGYHQYLIKPFHQFKESIAEKAIPQESNYRGKGDTSIAERAIEYRGKDDTSIAEKAILQSPSDIQNQNIQKENFNKDSKKTVDKSGGNSDWHCNDCANYDSHHVDSRGNTAGYCVTLKMSCPPYTFAGACEHFKNFFASGVENNQEKVEKSQEV